MDHSGALAHTAYRYGFSTELDLYRCLFLLGICCHDGFCCLKACLAASRKLRCHGFYSVCDTVDGKLHSDDTCGCYQYAVFRDPKAFGCCLGCFPAIAESFLAGTGVGDSAVADHSSCTRVIIYNVLIPSYRSCFYHIGREGSCSHTGNLTEYHAISVRPLYLISAAVDAALKPFAAVTPPSMIFILYISSQW